MEKLCLHHVGVVVPDLDKSLETYTTVLGMQVVTERVFDPTQQVNIIFLKTADGSLVELIEPAGETSPAARKAKEGGGIDHLCYIVKHIDEAVADLRKKGAIVTCAPVPATAFNGRKVAFLVHRRLGVFELVEERPDGDTHPV